MGGGLGLLPKKERFYEELNALGDVETTIIAGRNEKLHQRLAGGAALLLVTHDAAQAQRLAHRHFDLAGGQLQPAAQSAAPMRVPA